MAFLWFQSAAQGATLPTLIRSESVIQLFPSNIRENSLQYVITYNLIY